MNLIYIAVGLSPKSSVFNKMSNQIIEMNNCGLNARGIIFSNQKFDNSDSTKKIEFKQLPKFNYRGFLSKLKTAQKISNYILHDLAKEDFDIIFIRSLPVCFSAFKIYMKYSKKLFLYLPSDAIKENYQIIRYATYNSIFHRIISWLNYFIATFFITKILRLFILQKLNGIVCFTPEFCSIIEMQSLGKVKTIYNRDGYDKNKIKARNYINTNSKNIKLLFLKGSSTSQPWSGLRRIIKSIELSKDQNIELIIAGSITDPENYQYPFVTLTGRLDGEELNKLVDKVDIGVSNLENYLIGFNQLTNLKSREYYARGLPFIQSAAIPDIDPFEESKYYLNIPNDNSAIAMSQIRNFVDFVRQDTTHPLTMHKFAREHLGWDTTVKELVAQMLEIKLL